MSKTKVNNRLRTLVSEDFNHRCAYCRTTTVYTAQFLFIDHIIPESKGGKTVRSNLCVACERCNSYKRDQTHREDPATDQMVALFHPHQQQWRDHFKWSEDGVRMIGLTATGRATIEALKCNNEGSCIARAHWVSVGWHPPKD